jgi:hypothetical protein
MSKTEIPLSKLIKEVIDSFGITNNIHQAIFQASITLAEKIQLSLRFKESLRLADSHNPNSVTPVGIDKNAHIICPEILGWSN